MNCKLVRVSGGADVPVVGTVVVGRLAECDVQLTQGLPSRRHARISVVGDAVWVEDLDSANGTFVNGQRIAAKTALRSGDVVRFDVEEFRFQVEGEAHDNAGAPTLYRAPPKPSETTEPKTQVMSRSAEPPPPAKAAAVQEQIAESSGQFRRPGAWADPESGDGANKTKFMDPDALRALLESAPKADAAAADAVVAPSLIVLSGARGGARINLQAVRGKAAEWRIGSGSDCEVQFAEDGVSTLHAKLTNEGARWKLVDQMSANGCYVNGKRTSMAYLSAGDRIAVGPVECEFQLPAAVRVSAAPIVVPTFDPDRRKLRMALIAVGALLAIGFLWLWLRA